MPNFSWDRPPVASSPISAIVTIGDIDSVDIVCGVRRGVDTGGKLGRWWRHFASPAFLLFGLWLRDPASPARLYRRSIFERIPIQSNGWFAQVEILAKANFLGCL